MHTHILPMIPCNCKHIISVSNFIRFGSHFIIVQVYNRRFKSKQEDIFETFKSKQEDIFETFKSKQEDIERYVSLEHFMLLIF